MRNPGIRHRTAWCRRGFQHHREPNSREFAFVAACEIVKRRASAVLRQLEQNPAAGLTTVNPAELGRAVEIAHPVADQSAAGMATILAGKRVQGGELSTRCELVNKAAAVRAATCGDAVKVARAVPPEADRIIAVGLPEFVQHRLLPSGVSL